MREPPRRHAAREHVLGTHPEHDDHAGEDEEDCNRREDRPRLYRVAGGLKGAFDRGAETMPRQRLVGKGLQHAHRADQLRGIGGGVRERILRHARATAHRAAEAVERQHDHRDGGEHKRGEPRTGDDHHRRRADEQHRVAQGDRNRGADRGLDLSRVGAEPRNQLAAFRLVEIGKRERNEMAEYSLAQVGDDALAQCGDEIKSGGARQREHRDDGDHDREVAVDQVRALA